MNSHSNSVLPPSIPDRLAESKPLDSRSTPLSTGIGEGSTDGSTRKKTVEQREKSWGRVLERVLSLHPDQSSRGPRPVWSWRQRDKMSSSWLLCLPGSGGLSSPQFSEGLANLLCTPSPCCMDRLGDRQDQGRFVWRQTLYRDWFTW